MIPVGQPYRPAGTLDVRSIFITLILGTTGAILGAALVWLWAISPIPTILLATSMFQGLGVGLVMLFPVYRLRIRNPRLVGFVGFACGLISIVLVHYGLYIHMATAMAGAIRHEITEEKTLREDVRRALLAKLDTDPASFVDPVLVKVTGHRGFLGSLVYRNRQGVMIKSGGSNNMGKVTGTFLWLLWLGEAIMAATMAALFPWLVAGAPFCEECGCWCKWQHLFTLPATATAPLVEAVQEDNPTRVTALRASPPAADGSDWVRVTLHYCPGCDQSFSDVSHGVVYRKKTEVKTLLKRLRVSPEMVAALRTRPRTRSPGGCPSPPPGSSGDTILNFSELGMVSPEL